MKSKNDSFIIRSLSLKLPDLPIFFFIYIFIGILTIPNNFLLDDLDVCWLTRTGELIWQNGQLPTADVFSFTHQGKPWVLYQWGFEFFLGGLHLLAGLGGVVWGGALLIALTYSLLFHFLLKLGIHRGVCIGLVVLTMLINSFHWLCRPNTASILFYTYLIIFLENHRRSPKNHTIWALPLLFLLWANVHLGFTSGLMVLLVYALGAWFFPTFFREEQQVKDCRLMLVFFLCLIATFINPYGPYLFKYLWELSQATNMNRGISELHSPDFHSPFFLLFALQICLVFLISHKTYSGRELLLVVLCITLIMALFSARHIPYFSIPAIIHLAYSWKARSGIENKPINLLNQHNGWGWGLTIATICLAGVTLAHRSNLEFYDFSEKRAPKAATAFLEKNLGESSPARIFTSGGGAQWNDYLLYKLFPRVKLFIDTRFDMYGDEFFKKFIILRQKLRCSLQPLEPWRIDFLIIEKNQGKDKNDPTDLVGWPPATFPWKLIYEDDQAMIYRNLKNATMLPKTEPNIKYGFQ